MKQQIPGGLVHNMPEDLHDIIVKNPATKSGWMDITPIARNEWICWVENAKLIDTRHRRIERAKTELAEGKRRPCCWPGCMHREKTSK